MVPSLSSFSIYSFHLIFQDHYLLSKSIINYLLTPFLLHFFLLYFQPKLSSLHFVILFQIHQSLIFLINYIAKIYLEIKLTMPETQALRASILQQSDIVGTKQRFGLFSQPISTAIGDDGPYKAKLHPRGENGKPVTQLRNFYTNPTKHGMLDYFEPLKSLATSNVKDVFIEQGKRLLQQENQRFSHGRKQSNFFPASGPKTLINSAYKYVEQKNPQLNPKRFRQQDGRVKSQPRNFYTNPMTKVDKQVFKGPQHMTDPYDRKHQVEVQLMKKSKALEGEAPFRPNSFVPKTLNPDKKTYGLDVQINKKTPRQPSLNIYNHENPFKISSPMKSGYEGFLGPLPKYIQNPPKQTKRIDLKANEKGQFKSMTSILSKPCPSITMMSARRSVHSSLKR